MFIPYLFSFVVCIFLTIGSYTSRYSRVAGYPPIQFCVDFSCFSGIFYLFGFVYECLYGEGYPIGCILSMIVAGICIVVAFILLNAAVLTGKGALAMAVSQTQSFFWLLLEMVFSLRLPFFYEAVAMGFGIAGAMVISFAKN